MAGSRLLEDVMSEIEEATGAGAQAQVRDNRLVGEVMVGIGALLLGVCLTCTLLVLKDDGGSVRIAFAAVSLSAGIFGIVMGGLTWIRNTF